jgi:predicted transcriptional regulator
VRGLAGGLHSGSPLLRAMTADVTTCSPDDELADALHAMAVERVRRLPVCRDDGVLVGMLSISDAARNEEYGAEAVAALATICHPRGPHSQSRHAA